MEEASFRRLIQFLKKLPHGRVPLDLRPELIQLLKKCWELFSGSTEKEMESDKLQRIEAPYWETPLLKFTIERHRGTVFGSTRAELQHWIVDLGRRSAECYERGYRQLYPRVSPVDVKPIADELVNLIISGSQDDRLQWSAGGRVRVLTGTILPVTSAVKRTLEGRRKRFLKAMEELLTPHGWKRRGSWWKRKEGKEKP